MAINPYIDSANIFVYPCANRKEGFWESKLATEYSLRTLIPWKITKPSFVITGDATASNLEFVINGYYFNIKSNWHTAINPTSGQPLWAHIRLANKLLTSTAEGETTTILVNYEDGGQILDEGTSPNYTFKGVRFDSSAGTEATNYYHLQILDEAGNFLHRDMIKINCDDPLEQDDETGLLSLKYRSPLKVDNEELTLNYDSTLTLSSDKLSVTNPANTYIQPVTSGTHASAGTLTYLKVGNNYYAIPQGKTYTASNQGIILDNTTFKLLTSDGLAIGVGDTGTNKYLRIALANNSGLSFDSSLPGKLSIKLADNSGLDKANGLKINLNSTCGLTIDANNFLALKLASNSGLNKDSGLSLNLANNSGLDKSNGLKIKVNATSGLELTSDGLKMKYPLPDITGNDSKILAVNSAGTNLEWVEKPSGGGGTYSAGSGIAINSNNAISVSLATSSGLEFNSSKQLRLKKSNGINIDSNGVFIKLKTSSGLTCDTNGLALNSASRIINFTLPSSSITANFQAICSFVHNMLVIRFSYVGGANLDSYWINTSSISTANFTGLIPYVGNNNGLDCNFICPAHTDVDSFGYFNLHINQSNMYNQLVLTGYTSFEGAHSTTPVYISFKNFVRALHGLTLSIPIWTNMFN